MSFDLGSLAKGATEQQQQSRKNGKRAAVAMENDGNGSSDPSSRLDSFGLEQYLEFDSQRGGGGGTLGGVDECKEVRALGVSLLFYWHFDFEFYIHV